MMQGTSNVAMGGNNAGNSMNGVYNVAIGTYAGQSMS